MDEMESSAKAVDSKVRGAGNCLSAAMAFLGRAERLGIKDPIKWIFSRELVEEMRRELIHARTRIDRAISMLDEILF